MLMIGMKIYSPIGDALNIHRSYLNAVDAILEKDWLKGISHITGGGIVNNTKF